MNKAGAISQAYIPSNNVIQIANISLYNNAMLYNLIQVRGKFVDLSAACLQQIYVPAQYLVEYPVFRSFCAS